MNILLDILIAYCVIGIYMGYTNYKNVTKTMNKMLVYHPAQPLVNLLCSVFVGIFWLFFVVEIVWDGGKK